MKRRCLGVAGSRCTRLISTGRRCAECNRAWDTARQAKRGRLYYGDWQRRRDEQRARVPYCEDCGKTTNLTADHVLPGVRSSPLRTLCRSCNSARANRARAGGVGVVA